MVLLKSDDKYKQSNMVNLFSLESFSIVILANLWNVGMQTYFVLLMGQGVGWVYGAASWAEGFCAQSRSLWLGKAVRWDISARGYKASKGLKGGKHSVSGGSWCGGSAGQDRPLGVAEGS